MVSLFEEEKQSLYQFHLILESNHFVKRFVRDLARVTSLRSQIHIDTTITTLSLTELIV